ncbi:hypothetical protein [Streptomyces rubellomurinus]|uniref:Uncharacterized protein n=2 Tax=Streptomyces TaxID=1883 RepID=A0A0F2TD25_STRR3|nr:hypothetical protein [Streptomyces rubellomurinus]KJS53112.1 hypothetical protein VM98_27340 [Streptomyces rubellomurinus subsp. indigoferus]KJS61098.1 hypothetical protein VM95_16865 [Streptomyces rubellomurinus]
MSDAAQPTIAEVRAAAEAVKAAIDRHLEAVSSPSAADDPAVSAAYEQLATAAIAYDQLLYEVYDEVTPFEIPGDEGPGGYHGPEQPEAISVLIRRDYHVVDPERLRAQAERLDETLTPGGAGGVNAALGVLFGEYEPDEIAARSEEFGLEEADSTLWVAAAEPTEPGEWLPEPFEHADPQLLICRFDVSEVYDDEEPED